jgi:hypothetical protein
MAFASERYVHFLLDIAGRPPQRCRVSFSALAILEGIHPVPTPPHRATALFLKHRKTIEAVAREKFKSSAYPQAWISVDADDVDASP